MQHHSSSVMRLCLFVSVAIVVGSSSTVVVSVAMMSVVAVMVIAVVASVVGGGNRNLEVVPCEVGENTVLDVTTQVSLLGERISILL